MNGINEKRFAFLFMRDDDVYLVMEHRESGESTLNIRCGVASWMRGGGPGICLELSLNMCYVLWYTVWHAATTQSM